MNFEYITGDAPMSGQIGLMGEHQVWYSTCQCCGNVSMGCGQQQHWTRVSFSMVAMPEGWHLGLVPWPVVPAM